MLKLLQSRRICVKLKMKRSRTRQHALYRHLIAPLVHPAGPGQNRYLPALRPQHAIGPTNNLKRSVEQLGQVFSVQGHWIAAARWINHRAFHQRGDGIRGNAQLF